ncbi:unnamed protein product [Gongylonema pulchrum]|uniref:Sec7_N domain-containing protein n=1 Tax=Gongylonema pulchrum TaxID=637853 RepID=A0A183E796_9BILA|nr:unnamed protein product [Gongylonema pulchrum]
MGNGVDVSNPERLLIDRIVEAICSPFSGPNTDEGVQLQILKVINAVFGNMLKAEEAVSLTDDSDEKIVQAVVNYMVDQVAVQSDEQSSGTSRQDSIAISMAAEVLAAAPRSLNPVSLAADSSEHIGDDVPSLHLYFRSVQEEDAFLLFRALCRLSTKALPEQLSLEMLLLIVQNSSSLIHSSQPFILALRHLLCVSLSRNGVSPIVSKICEDPQSMVDIYVNYDCDLTATNIFERIIDGLFKVAQTLNVLRQRQLKQLQCRNHQQYISSSS